MLVCCVCVQEAYLCVRIAAESMTILTKPCVKITIPQCTTTEQTNCTSKRVTNSMSSHFSQWAAGGLMTWCFLHSHTLQCVCMSMVSVYYVFEISPPPLCVCHHLNVSCCLTANLSGTQPSRVTNLFPSDLLLTHMSHSVIGSSYAISALGSDAASTL